MLNVIHSGTRALTLIVTVIAICPAAHSHSADERAPRKPASDQAERRIKARQPQTLNNLDIEKIVSKVSIPDDVLIIKCALGPYSPCRGIGVSLSDETGTKVIVSYSGTLGLIGFEGLRSGVMYQAQIESTKYHGQTAVTPGQISTIDGELHLGSQKSGDEQTR